MPILVDTNVLLDILTGDPQWEEWSSSQWKLFQGEGFCINPVIFSELCVGAESVEEALAIVKDFNLEVHEVDPKALFLAAKAFLKYRKSGGAKSSPLPDFFIGAQAESQKMRLLTRDTQRYRTYFPKVELISPET